MKAFKPAEPGQEIQFPKGLEPLSLRRKLWSYQKELGRQFALGDLLKIEEIHAKMTLAEAVRHMRQLYGAVPEQEGRQ